MRIIGNKVQEGEIVESAWDIKKIGIGIAILVPLLIAGAYVLFPVGSGPNTNSNKGILGISAQDSTSTKDVPPLPTKDDIEQIITSAKNTLSQITSDNLTSSQAAIQKIIGDLQVLQGKKDAVGVFCDLVCKK